MIAPRSITDWRVAGIAILAGVLLACAGCGGDNFPLSAETDDPHYREAQQLEKEGRNPEALADYLKVIDKRGDAAPESHLEAGLIFLQYGEDPISAIYHFRKYLDLEPNSTHAGEVKGLIDRAKLNFARTLPGHPLENPDAQIEESDLVGQLRRENEELRAELAAYRNGTAPSPSPATAPPADASVSAPAPATPEPAGTPAVAEDQAAAAITLAPLPRDGSETAAPAAAPTGRTHTVAHGDTLYNLALKYYGPHSAGKVRDIVAANRDKLSSPSSPLKIGMVLKIP